MSTPGRLRSVRTAAGLGASGTLRVAWERVRPRFAPLLGALIAPSQQRTLSASKHHQDVAVFVCPMGFSGGVLSVLEIASIADRVGMSGGFDARLAYLPGSGRVGRRHPHSPTGEPIAPLDTVLAEYSDAERVWLFVPEIIAAREADVVVRTVRAADLSTAHLVVDVMNQNVALMPTPEALHRFGEALGADELTVTTAHQAHSNPAAREHFGVPTHHFAAWVFHDDYTFARYSDRRRRRLLVSPDSRPERDAVMAALQRELPDLDVVVIKGLTYREYTELVMSSTFSLTFGEGFDGYFAEMGLAGGVPFGVYDDRYFMPEYAELPNVFADYAEMEAGLPDLIRRIEADPSFREELVEANLAILRHYLDRGKHIDAIARYFAGMRDLP